MARITDAGVHPTSLPGNHRMEIEEARQRVATYVDQSNNARLHSAIGSVTPADKLNGLKNQIFDEHGHKLEAARERRALSRLSLDASKRFFRTFGEL